MKRLFIVGASILQVPAILKAKEMGLYVAVADINPNAIGIDFTDEFFNVSTIDKEGIYRAAKMFRADGIITLATDQPMRPIAYACSRLGLVGISEETAYKATQKDAMIEAFKANNVPHPWYYILEKPSDLSMIIDKVEYPCISKPTDNSGSRGVVIIHNESELMSGVHYSSSKGRSGRVIIEELLEGPEVSVELIAYQGEITVVSVTDKLTSGPPYFVELGHSQPSRLLESEVAAVSELAKQAVKAVGIDNGAAHVEIILTKSGPKMVELGARLGGDCICTHLVPLSTGVDMVKAVIDISLGYSPDLDSNINMGSAIRYITANKGIISSINNVDNALRLPGVKDIYFNKKVGESIDEIKSSADRIGFVIAQGKDAEDAIRICEQAKSIIEIHTVDANLNTDTEEIRKNVR